jgi:hypothetical protein
MMIDGNQGRNLHKLERDLPRLQEHKGRVCEWVPEIFPAKAGLSGKNSVRSNIRHPRLRILPIGSSLSFTKPDKIGYFAIRMGRPSQEMITAIIPKFLPLRWSQVLGGRVRAAVHPGILAIEQFRPICDHFLAHPQMAAMASNSRLEQWIIARLCRPHPGPLSFDIQPVARVTEVIRTAGLSPPFKECVQKSIAAAPAAASTVTVQNFAAQKACGVPVRGNRKKPSRLAK